MNSSIYYNLIINIPNDFEDKFNIDFDIYCFDLLKELDISFIATILHDLDKRDDGYLKTKHLHVVLILKKRISKVKLLDIVSNKLYFDKNCISLDICNNFNSSVRYLVHKDNPDKFQYFEGNILSNNIERVNSILNNPNIDYLDFTTLYQLCLNCPDITDIMSIIGLQNYKKYRSCIMDIRENISYCKTR